jgi:hypothetical protein
VAITRERLSAAFLKPPRPGDEREQPAIEAVVTDKERLIGLIAAPAAAAIGLLVISALVANDPTGAKHVRVSLYEELLAVLMVLSVAMLAGALLRKRMVVGVAAALYGLSVFNLRYWGFGVPFVLVGAWYLVRAYRRQKELKLAMATPAPTAARVVGASKRHTPRRS